MHAIFAQGLFMSKKYSVSHVGEILNHTTFWNHTTRRAFVPVDIIAISILSMKYRAQLELQTILVVQTVLKAVLRAKQVRTIQLLEWRFVLFSVHQVRLVHLLEPRMSRFVLNVHQDITVHLTEPLFRNRVLLVLSHLKKEP